MPDDAAEWMSESFLIGWAPDPDARCVTARVCLRCGALVADGMANAHESDHTTPVRVLITDA